MATKTVPAPSDQSSDEANDQNKPQGSIWPILIGVLVAPALAAGTYLLIPRAKALAQTVATHARAEQQTRKELSAQTQQLRRKHLLTEKRNQIAPRIKHLENELAALRAQAAQLAQAT